MSGRGVTPTTEELLWGSAGASPAEAAAAKRDRGSVPSSMELSGSGATEPEDEDEEDVLPLRAPRRDLESVTWGERRAEHTHT